MTTQRVVTIMEIENSINRWRDVHPAQDGVNCAEVNQLANVYAQMIYRNLGQWEVGEDLVKLLGN